MRILIAPLLLVLVASAGRADDRFTREVRPILAQHCFKCHGPDEKARKGKLRLDTRADALKPGRSGSVAIVPGKPDQSEFVRRLFIDDETEVMPPPHAKNPLSARQKAILKEWVAAGAEYTAHWAFVAPAQAPLPAVKQKDWPRNAIDHFVLARLEAEGLRPSPLADRLTLARRVSLDLIGLPPTPAEADAFVKDESADAYEKYVDRLLASPRYGERWARRWLDLARYADTNGYEKDRPRSIWPYRDWVINALNKDMPFDQFTIEQIAGDLLPGATTEQRIATGFHRNTMLNEEGGIDPLEFRFHAMNDRVATTGTVWLGLTLGCVQCHAHKYDPIGQREYYQLFAFLNNADEPDLDVTRPELSQQRQQIEQKIKTLLDDLSRKTSADDPKFKSWLAQERKRTSRWAVLRPTEVSSNLPLLTIQKDDSVFVSGDQGKSDTYTLKFRTDAKKVRAIRLEALPDDRLPKHGPGRVYYEGPPGDFMLSEIAVLADGKKVRLSGASHTYATGSLTASAALDGNQQTGWSINGGQGRAHTAVFTFAEPFDAPGGAFTLTLLFEKYYAAGLGRFRVSVTADEAPVARDFPPEVDAALLQPDDSLTPQARQLLLHQYLLSGPETAAQRAEIDKLRKQMPAYPTTLVMQERPAENPRPTYLHNRGEFLQPTDKVEPGVLSFLHPLSKDATKDRLTFARWLVAPDNPLVGRVTMNRQWAAFFGQGIVRTPGDFGLQGEAPTHPALLDWLAVELVKQKWSMKKMHRLIVTSATYRQTSRLTPGLRTKDPDNRLLARGPKVRLDAEQLRDSVLTASALLSDKMGGPSVFPPQPSNVSTEGAYGRLEWKVSEGPDRYRRGLYTFSKRTAPYAMFATFDGPSGEFCTARREMTNTPLQALTMLNDTVILDAAQALGRTMIKTKGDVDTRVVELHRRCLTRPPLPEERKLLVSFYQAQLARAQKKELDAAALAGPGEGDVNERAAWTALARVLFNLDEAITRD